ncbi:hypothetical protein ACO0QE_002126 [Hanseniaspora vineae]
MPGKSSQASSQMANNSTGSSNGTALSMFQYLNKVKSLYETGSELRKKEILKNNRLDGEGSSIVKARLHFMWESLKLLLKTPIYMIKSMHTAIQMDREALQLRDLMPKNSTSLSLSSSPSSNMSNPSYSHTTNDNIVLFQFEMNYFFSFYSLSCIMSALLLARINYMSTTTLRRRRVNPNEQLALKKMEKISRAICYTAVIVLLCTMLGFLYKQVEISQIADSSLINLEVFKIKQQQFLKLCFFAFVISEANSLLINNIYTIKKPSLTTSDYTLFDLSLLFYSFDQHPITATKSLPFAYTVVIAYCIVSHLSINFLELIKKRKLWFKVSSTLNVGYTGWLLYLLYTGEYFSLPMVVKYTSLPKLTSLFIITLSSFSFLLTCTVMGFKNLEILQYYKFFKNLKSHLNFTGEEEFNTIILKLSLFLTNSTGNSSNGNGNLDTSVNPFNTDAPTNTAGKDNLAQSNPLLSNDLGDVNMFKNIGMLNKFEAYPEHMFKDEEETGQNSSGLGNDKNGVWGSKMLHVHRFSPLYRFFYKLHVILLLPWKKVKKISHKGDNEVNGLTSLEKDIGYVNINEMINENNYYRLLINPKIGLFPDTDNSKDYECESSCECNNERDGEDSVELVGEVVDEKSDCETFEESDLDLAEMREELPGLLHLDELIYEKECKQGFSEAETPLKDLSLQDDSDFYYEVLKLSLASKKFAEKFTGKLTRSKYLALNEPNVLRSVVQEKRLEHWNRKHGEKVEFLHEDDDLSDFEDVISEHSCVVCKTNLRCVILWPCRCLCMCDDCRVSLGVRGFNKCPCCRSTVEGFSKINNV